MNPLPILVIVLTIVTLLILTRLITLRTLDRDIERRRARLALLSWLAKHPDQAGRPYYFWQTPKQTYVFEARELDR